MSCGGAGIPGVAGAATGAGRGHSGGVVGAQGCSRVGSRARGEAQAASTIELPTTHVRKASGGSDRHVSQSPWLRPFAKRTAKESGSQWAHEEANGARPGRRGCDGAVVVGRGESRAAHTGV